MGRRAMIRKFFLLVSFWLSCEDGADADCLGMVGSSSISSCCNHRMESLEKRGIATALRDAVKIHTSLQRGYKMRRTRKRLYHVKRLLCADSQKRWMIFFCLDA